MLDQPRYKQDWELQRVGVSYHSSCQRILKYISGMWTIECEPNVADPEIWIEIRDSQWKHNVGDPNTYDWAFEVVNVSGLSPSKRIGDQTLQVLEFGQAEECNERTRALIRSIQIKQDEIQKADLFGAVDRGKLRRALETMCVKSEVDADMSVERSYATEKPRLKTKICSTSRSATYNHTPDGRYVSHLRL